MTALLALFCEDCGGPLPADTEHGETKCPDCKALQEEREAREWAENNEGDF